jgi:hypothetical protein
MSEMDQTLINTKQLYEKMKQFSEFINKVLQFSFKSIVI